MPSPLSQRQDSGSSSESRIVKPFTRTAAAGSPTRPAPSMDIERNSYFRRLSTLPSSTISGAVPQSLLSVIDSVRSILFAVCQVYQTLQHYTVYAIDDRLTSVLRKVLDPASADMMQLINALDRFDAMSRKTLPPPSICRSVVEHCKDTVAVFSKAVGVLSLQLKVLATRDDVRYLRQMLLILYGATAEISHAWQAMAPHIEAIKPLLREHRAAPSLAKSHPPHPSGRALAGFGTTHYPFTPTTGPVAEEDESPHLPSSQPGAVGGLQIGRTRTARRHAGSFSSKDVEIGKKLPSYEDSSESPVGGISRINTRTHIPTTRVTGRRAGPALAGPSSAGVYSRSSPYQISPGSMASSSPPSGGPRPTHPVAIHSRQGSQTSLHTSSAASSPSMPFKAPPLLQIPSNSRSLVDKEALDAMKKAVEAAPAIWTMMDEILGDDLDTNIDVRGTLSAAKSVTTRLGKNIQAMQRGDPTADRKSLREDAHVFVKTVVQLSNIIKTRGGASSALRSKMVKLTNATEEFVILLHVSSYSPSSTPRPYSPIVTNSPMHNGLSGLGGAEDSRLGASLSRSRSAQPASSTKVVIPSQRDGPRSALPNQTFHIPAIQRIRKGGIDTPETG
jgi:hypothetical protein